MWNKWIKVDGYLHWVDHYTKHSNTKKSYFCKCNSRFDNFVLMDCSPIVEKDYVHGIHDILTEKHCKKCLEIYMKECPNDKYVISFKLDALQFDLDQNSRCVTDLYKRMGTIKKLLRQIITEYGGTPYATRKKGNSVSQTDSGEITENEVYICECKS